MSRNCPPGTQSQALNVLALLFRHVLGRELEVLKFVTWARRKQHIPTVMTRQEVQRVLEH